ncbi:MAG: pseudouridine synthase [Actinomycetota bacterium]
MPEPGTAGAETRMRLQRALAQAGVASRRAAEEMIAAGRVRVNGEVAAIGMSVGPGDVVEVDGRRIRREELHTYLLNKRSGTVCTASDPQGRPTVVDAVPAGVRVYPVGRLDFATTGAILLTNDGELAHRLMHPRSGVPKVYEAVVNGCVGPEALRALREGVELEDGVTRPARVEVLHAGRRSTVLRIEITEGRNRQVRRMGIAVGHPVIRLTRVRYDGLGVDGLAPGEWRELRPDELTRLGATVGLER